MASLRRIKKDIVFMINEVISDCWMYTYLHEDGDMEEAGKIISDAIAMGDDMFERINRYPKENAGAYFNEINKDLAVKTDELFKRVSALAKKKK